MERIPTPRRDNRPTDQLPRVVESRRSESRGRRAARGPEDAAGGRTRNLATGREQDLSDEHPSEDELLAGPADEGQFEDDLREVGMREVGMREVGMREVGMREDDLREDDLRAVDPLEDEFFNEDGFDPDDEELLDAESLDRDDLVPDFADGEPLAGVAVDEGRRGREDEESSMDRASGSTRTGSARAVIPAYAQPDAPSRRRRGAPPRWRFRRVAWIAAAVAALLGLGAAALVIFPGLRGDSVNDSPAQPLAAAPASVAVESAFGEQVERTDGWTVKIEEPVAVKSTDDIGVPDDADRAVRLDVVLTNNGTEPKDSAGWAVKAIVGSSPVDVLPVGGAPSRTVRPGASLTFPVTVPMPAETTDLQLEAAPTTGVPTLFVGTA